MVRFHSHPPAQQIVLVLQFSAQLFKKLSTKTLGFRLEMLIMCLQFSRPAVRMLKMDIPENQPISILPSTFLTLPVLPIREGVLFPHTESILTFGRETSLKGIEAATKTNNRVVLATQKTTNTDDPRPEDLYQIGTLAVIERTIKSEDTVSALIRGIGRVQILDYIETKPAFIARTTQLREILDRDPELMALASHLQKTFRKTVQMGKPVEFLNFMKLLGNIKENELADQIASTLGVKTQIKQSLLEMLDVKQRIKEVIFHITKEIKVLEIEKDVVHKTQAQFDKHMRENVLRERLRTIQKELGELDDDEQVSDEYLRKLKKLKVSPEIAEKIKKEIKRLKQMSVANPESGYIRSWLDTVFDLPWGIEKATNIEMDFAEKTLRINHYGLEEIKDRILEFIAVLKLKQKQQAKKHLSVNLPTILCFAGPPGVGKTSLGRSIADALGRDFTKISLGGVRDEAEIRGHRRTYVGAMTGRIIRGISQVKSSNPVFILDEIDKLGQDFRGDPSSALLEVLDPEQNQKFEDHYLDMPFDLSKVLFITTANTLDTIPPALRDRLEVIRFSGYTPEEKLHITKEHLWEKVVRNNGLQAKNLKISDNLIEMVIQSYTREAGVRDLERSLNKVVRKLAKQIVDGSIKPNSSGNFSLTEKMIEKYLGPAIYDHTLTEKTNQVGLATGLAWTQMGGEILFVEVALTPGKGEIRLTGKLGDVMKESAQAALTYIKANTKEIGLKQTSLNKTDVHIHIPEGAIPKDGPSAGITMTTALVSAFLNSPVDRTVAMTGEVTLRGNVLPIGGLKEKSIAAYRAGCRVIIYPEKNKRDLIKIPASVKKNVKFIPVKHMSEVLKIALIQKTNKT
ncbi:MAG: endopeptidase La [Patescibacteria group bacterium]